MSINIGLSGLRATSEQINTISHNIANVDTIGYKSSRTEFQDVYAPQFGGGEMGGVEVSDIRQNFIGGATVNTGRNGDLAINGEGFFMVESNAQQMYTRNGVFNLDAEGNLVSADGYKLMGYGVTDTGAIQNGSLTSLSVNTADMPAKTTSKMFMGVNLDANAPAIDDTNKNFAFDPENPSTFTSSATTTVFDSLGGEHAVTQYYVKTGNNSWKVHYMVDDNKTPVMEQQVTFGTDGQLATPNKPINLSFAPTNGSAPMNVQIDMSGFTQFGSDFSINKNNQDGCAPGKLAGWYFDNDGVIYARYSNGKTQAQGQVLLARFPNQEGLQQAGGTRWTQTIESGAPITGSPGSGQLGKLRTNMYEGSNVNLTGEMVSLMAAQSNYQANAKTIQASQQMVQILFQNM
ncbi:flagellar hook-basal body complex protein [Parasalinivibrio latis]|uniref:flagellar hook protein FlgE n=1 Tax=Parasalinivibrio latis TaxID=2952610 RepID=UPI0030E3F10E